MYTLVDGERGVLVERIVNSEQTFCPHDFHGSPDRELATSLVTSARE